MSGGWAIGMSYSPPAATVPPCVGVCVVEGLVEEKALPVRMLVARRCVVCGGGGRSMCIDRVSSGYSSFVVVLVV